jgi:NAD(P)-dependent dehydrogenase (short-subunit alcohol dehydrogenase family)
MFKDKVAVITGAGSGIGRALAVQLAEQGALLALSDINAQSLAETMQMLPVTDVSVRAYQLDVSSRQAVFDHADQVSQDFGSVHFVFNNAGATIIGTVNHTSIEEFEWQLGINMWGVLYGTKAFLPIMLAQREGCIVNISSVFGLLSFPTQGPYNMSKFAVRGLTECLWSELEGTGVRAVSVHPGGIKTNIAAVARRCQAADETEASFSEGADDMLITPPAECARDIIAGLRSGKRRILTGNKSTTLFWMSRIFPSFYPTLLKRLK